MSNIRVIAIVLAAVMIVLMVFYANGSMGQVLCRHFKGGWLETHGYITCYRAP